MSARTRGGYIRKTKKATFYKKPSFFKAGGVRSIQSQTRNPVGPPSIYRKLRYVTQVSINAGLGTPGVHIFSANGMFDPDVTGAGHQPMGFDQYMVMYDHYTVVNSKITVTALGLLGSTSSADQVVIGVYLDDDVTATTSLTSILEQGLSSYRVVNAGAVSPTTISKGFSKSTFFGARGWDDSLQGSITSQPGDQAFFRLFANALGSGEDPGSVKFLVTIDYVCKLSERKTLGGS